MKTFLQPQFDARKSFYNKAIVINKGNVTTLQSYNTIVAKIENNKAIALNTDEYSTTTLRHVKEFLKQNGFRAESKKQILIDYK